MKRLLITGAHGFVAGSVISQAGPDVELHAVSRGKAFSRSGGLRWHQLDPCDEGQLARCFDQVRPDSVIHTAALADIDFCEAHQELARMVNAGLTQTLAGLCARLGAKLVHCSTDTVFDGEHGPYREEDSPRPVNFYARTKVESENIVLQSGTSAVIARLAVVVGLPILGAGNSFLSRMIPSLKAGREIYVPPNEVRTPIDVITVGQALLELAASAHTGIFHLAGNDRLNRLDMTRRIAARLGFPISLIVSRDPGGIPGRASRPRDVSLDNSKARRELKTPMCSFDEGLALILQTAEQSTA